MESAVGTKPSQLKPWLKFFSDEAVNAELPEKTIFTTIYEANKVFKNNTALNYFGNKISYGELFNEIGFCAAAFESIGVKKGDIVAACSVTIPEMVYALYGLNKIGASLLVLDPRASVEGTKDFIEKSEANVFICLDLAYAHLKDLLSEQVETVIIVSADDSMPFGIKVIKKIKMPSPEITYTGNVLSWKSFSALGAGKDSYTAAYGENELAAITLTGGTTGFPKGVMLSNDGFNAVAMDFKYCGVSYTRDQRFLNIIPMFSSYGIVSSLHMPLSLGLECVIIPKFDQDKVGYYIKKYKPSHTLLVPSHYEKLMNSREMSDGFDLSFFETAGSGGDTMNTGLEAKLNCFLKEHGCRYPLSQGYGMSEVSSAASCCCNGNFKSQSVGYPLLTTDIAIFKPGTCEELGFNEEGEICISGPSIMLGYLGNAEDTAKTVVPHPDGRVWVHSGDIGYMDEEGYVFIKGRMKRMITLYNGHKIFPTHIENVIGKNVNVLSCAVVGVKDMMHAQGKLAMAFVELKGEANEDEIKSQLYDICEAELEGPAKPYDIRFIRNMPHTQMGKIDYKKLADDYEEMLAAAVC